MNPFLHDPVAQPFVTRSTNGWCRVFPQHRTRALALAAGMSLGFSAQAIDVNLASIDDLQRIRGLGPRTAAIIVQERDRAGRFESLQDLSDRVKGLGQRRLQSLQAAGLVVESTDGPTASATSARPSTPAVANVSTAAKANTRSNKRVTGLNHEVQATPSIEVLP